MDLTPVYLLLADLRFSGKTHLNQVVGPQGRFKPGRVLAQGCHWALLIRDTCFEVTTYDYDHDRGVEYAAEVRTPSFERWKLWRRLDNLNYSEPKKVGATRLTEHQIRDQGKYPDLWNIGKSQTPSLTILRTARFVWRRRCKGKYHGIHANCQNFVSVLQGQIQVPFNDCNLTKQERRSWRTMPWSISMYEDILRFTFVWAGTHILVKAAVPAVVTGLGLSGGIEVSKIVTALLAFPAALSKSDWFVIRMARRNKQFRKLRERAEEIDPRYFDDYRVPSAEYSGYHPELINNFNNLGYSVPDVVAALECMGIGNQNGQPMRLDDGARDALLLLLIQNCDSDADVVSPGLPSGYADSHRSFAKPSNQGTYLGYDKGSVEDIASLGFSVDLVVCALLEWGIETGDGAEFDFNDQDTMTLVSTMIRRQTGVQSIAS